MTCSLLWARVVGESLWKTLETHSNKTSTRLRVLKPDTTYQVKVQVQCLSKVHSTNDVLTLRTPEGRKCCPCLRPTGLAWCLSFLGASGRARGHVPQA